MTLLAVPNISEGTDPILIDELEQAVVNRGVRVLDIHSDRVHNRSVFTLTARPEHLLDGCVALAALAAARIDLTKHRGVHPRLGAMDVCPFVPHHRSMDEAIALAHRAAAAIASEVRLPIYLYGRAALRAETRELPELRRGGLTTLARRASTELPPDEGPVEIDPKRGVVCVGARGPLIAFNVWLRGDENVARGIAREVRSKSLRALGLEISDTDCQVSMNLVDPEVTGIEQAFSAVAGSARRRGIEITATEIVGLVSERFLPDRDATVTRLLKQPGHSLEASLEPPG